MLKYVFLFVILIAFSNTSFAQAEEHETSLGETGIWNGVYLKVKFSEKFGYYAEHHLRLRNDLDDVNSFVGRTRQVYNRAGLNVYINKNFEAVIGPTLVFNFSPDPDDAAFEKVTLEPRIWHQYLFKMNPMGRFNVYHQFRFEHRWKRDNNVGTDFDYTNRYRYKLFAYIPINSDEIKEKTWFVSPSAEIFMHSGKSVVYNPFEDFRTYNGIGYVLNNNITFFAGHMWTFGQKKTGFEYNTTHILRFNVFIGLDSRKEEGKVPSINLGY